MADAPDGTPPPPQDVVLLTGPTEDGQGIKVVRARGDQVDTGEVRPLKEGRPLGAGEIVRLEPRAGAPRVCDVEVLAKLGPAEAASEPGKHGERRDRGKGPPRVATDAYRESWDRIFGGRAERGAPN